MVMKEQIAMQLSYKETAHTNNRVGPRGSNNMVMTGGPLLAIRPTYSHHKLEPFHLTKDNIKHHQ